jgi:acyl carrier protein
MQTRQEEILARLQSIFDDVFFDEVVVTPELSAHDVEEWDSLLHISLVVAVEEAFGIRFRVGEVETTKNVGELARVIEARMDGTYV